MLLLFCGTPAAERTEERKQEEELLEAAREGDISTLSQLVSVPERKVFNNQAKIRDSINSKENLPLRRRKPHPALCRVYWGWRQIRLISLVSSVTTATWRQLKDSGSSQELIFTLPLSLTIINKAF